MVRTRIPPLHNLLPLISAILLVAIMGLMVLLGYEYEEETSSLRSSLEVQKSLAELFSTIQEAELGNRGFLLTGDEVHLDVHQKAVTEYPYHLDRLISLSAGNPPQKRRLEELRPLIEQRLALLKEGIMVRRTQGLPAAVEFVGTGRGRNAMTSVRAGIGQLQQQEANLLNERTAQAQRLIRMATISAIGTMFIVLFTIMGWIWTVRRDARLLASEALQREFLEEQNRQLQKMEAVGQLTGGIAHDFNNMLTVIISGLSIIKRRVAAGNMDVSEIADATIEGANRAALLTSRLMAFSRQQPLAPRAVDASAMLQNMSELINRSLGETIQVEFHFNDAVWPIYADLPQLESALLNLCVNSRDAMPHGGKLTIETHNVEINEGLARQMEVPAGQYVSIKVSDTGEGMPPEVVSRAFEPFFTTKGIGKGTGLGLSQVQGFIKQSNGHIKIYSEPGHGTSIKIYLPRHAVTEDLALAHFAVSTPASGTDRARSQHVILLVEDDAQVRQLNLSMLRDLGYAVIGADGAGEAMRQLEQHPEISLLFTDVVMPETNGRQLAEMALKLRPDLRVLYTTGFTRNAIIHGGKLDPHVNFIAKPFSLDQLAKKVASVLGEDLKAK